MPLPTRVEVMVGLAGAWRLARGDRSGMAWFDTTLDGCLKSFFAAALVAPLYGFLLLLQMSRGPVPHPVGFLLIESIAYVVSWVAFPLIMAGVTELIDRRSAYARFVVANNWAAVLQNAVYLPVAILVVAGGGMGAGLVAPLSFLAMAAVLFYQWFVVRTALEIPGPTAVAIVVLDLLVNVLLRTITETVVHQGPNGLQ